jgi:trk system potassium uptake protein TrkH
MNEGMTSLLYAVRVPVVARFLCQLGLVLAALSLVPLFVALLLGDTAIALRLAITVAAVAGLCLPGLRLTAGERLQVNEALVILALIFLFVPLAMTWPMMAAGLAAGDALFEAVSAFTTTGLTTVRELAGQPRGFLFLRGWMQWYGGLGIAVLSVALLMGHTMAARRLAQPEASEDLVTTASTHARQVLIAYAALTAIGVAILWIALGDGFAALLHMLTTLSTGGFAPHDDSLAVLPTGAVVVITAFSVLGALPFVLYYQLARGRPRGMREDLEVRGLMVALMLTVGAVCAALALGDGLSWPAAAAEALYLGVSAQTGSGFSHVVVAQLGPATMLILVLAMLVGGTIGSSSGGIKVFRVMIALLMLQFFLRRSAMPPHAVAAFRFAGRPLDLEDLQRVLLTVMLFVLTVIGCWLAFLAFGYPPLESLFEVSSAIATVGLSSGITSEALEPQLKAVLCAGMWLGRLEVFAMLVLLYPPTWFGPRTDS